MLSSRKPCLERREKKYCRDKNIHPSKSDMIWHKAPNVSQMGAVKASFLPTVSNADLLSSRPMSVTHSTGKTFRIILYLLRCYIKNISEADPSKPKIMKLGYTGKSAHEIPLNKSVSDLEGLSDENRDSFAKNLLSTSIVGH